MNTTLITPEAEILQKACRMSLNEINEEINKILKELKSNPADEVLKSQAKTYADIWLRRQ